MVKKLRRFINNIGCEMVFESDIPDDVIKERLSWMGSGWKEVDDKGREIKKLKKVT